MTPLARSTLALLFGACVVIGYGHWGYTVGETVGRNAVLAQDAEVAEAAHQTHDDHDAASAAATGQLNKTLGATLPDIQGKTHDTMESIRTVYRDRFVPVDQCTRPDGVQAALDAAVERANAAARGQL